MANSTLPEPAVVRTLARVMVRERESFRDPAERRAYAGDPWAYVSDIFGHRLTPQQEEVLALMEAEDRLLIPAGNNTGKTFVLAAYGIYVMDARAAVLDEETGLEIGARVLLPGPDHDTVFETVYSEMLELAARADRRGYPMPGVRSERSVLWRVRPKWHMEVLSPPRRVSQAVAHRASGRHHRNQVALIEEGQGVPEELWLAAEGMCSSAGNKIISPFNPTEPLGPAYSRARSGSYRVVHLSAFDHPNVTDRRPVIPGAVSHRVIDRRVQGECRDRGPYPQTTPEETKGDFVYAVPPREASEEGARGDGQLGHPEGQLRVYRPSVPFTAQVMGRWPATADTGLFDPGAWDQAVARWRARTLPDRSPDRVGVDPAREGEDESCGVPAWGETAEALLLAYVEAQNESAAALFRLRETRRATVGEPRVFPKGDGPDVAGHVASVWPAAPLNVDEGGVGASVLDHLARVMGRDAVGVSFAASPPEPTPGEPWSENLRTAMYVRAARLVELGLVDLPPDPLLREECMAQRVLHRSRTVRTGRSAERKPSVLLEPKEKLKGRLGRSPDRSDAFVLALHRQEARRSLDPDRWATVKT